MLTRLDPEAELHIKLLPGPDCCLARSAEVLDLLQVCKRVFAELEDEIPSGDTNFCEFEELAGSATH